MWWFAFMDGVTCCAERTSTFSNYLQMAALSVVARSKVKNLMIYLKMIHSWISWTKIYVLISPATKLASRILLHIDFVHIVVRSPPACGSTTGRMCSMEAACWCGFRAARSSRCNELEHGASCLTCIVWSQNLLVAEPHLAVSYAYCLTRLAARRE